MELTPDARAVWAQATIKVWPDPVILATFPRLRGDRVAAFAGRVGVRDTAAFVAFVAEGDECSLTAPARDFDEWRLKGGALEVSRNLRALTLEASMPVDLVGIFAPAAVLLAAEKIPIIPQCGFRTDHLLVPETRLADAVRVLEALIAVAQKESL